MKLKTLLIVLLIAMLALAACGGDDEDSDSGDSADNDTASQTTDNDTDDSADTDTDAEDDAAEEVVVEEGRLAVEVPSGTITFENVGEVWREGRVDITTEDFGFTLRVARIGTTAPDFETAVAGLNATAGETLTTDDGKQYFAGEAPTVQYTVVLEYAPDVYLQFSVVRGAGLGTIDEDGKQQLIDLALSAEFIPNE